MYVVYTKIGFTGYEKSKFFSKIYKKAITVLYAYTVNTAKCPYI